MIQTVNQFCLHSITKQLIEIKCDCLRDKHSYYLCKVCFNRYLSGEDIE